MLRSEAHAVELLETLPGQAAGEQARKAVSSGFDTVFACGGDGTLFHVLQGAAGSHATLGVIPLGTGNVLAQNLNLPRDPVAALRLQWNAEPVSVPLGHATCGDAEGRERSWYFTIAAGVGFHADLMGLAPNGRGKRLMGRAAYYGGGLRLLATRSVQPFAVELHNPNGAHRSFQAAELLAIRVPRINRWTPGGDLFSPHLRIASVPLTGRPGLAHACIHALLRTQTNARHNRLGLPYPSYEDSTRVVCEPAGAPLLVQADGEIIGAGRATFAMAEKSLRLLWPKSK